MKLVRLLIALVALASLEASAQIIVDRPRKAYVDSLRREFDNGPYFTLFRDNYFTVGTCVGHKPTADNSDVKFQVSIAQKLTRSTLPGNTYLFLTFTQLVTWDVFKNSMPMRDFTFNPGIGLARPIFSKERYLGRASLAIEHMSNGRDSIQSRSWNRISLGASIMIDDMLTVDGKFWIPIVDGQNNRDILKYTGLWQGGATVMSRNKKLGGSLHFVKRKGWNLSFNTTFELFWRPWNAANEYFFLQYYNGYGENLLDYNKFHSRLRVGIVIKPNLFSEY